MQRHFSSSITTDTKVTEANICAAPLYLVENMIQAYSSAWSHTVDNIIPRVNFHLKALCGSGIN